MSRHNRPNHQPPQYSAVDKSPQPNAPQASTPDPIESYRRCPLCWGEQGGYGVAYHTEGRRRYYKCKKSVKPEWGGCGHCWHRVIMPASVVESTRPENGIARRA